MMSLTTATEYAQGMLESGELKDAAAANIAIVRMMSIRIIDGAVPLEVRKGLLAGVKEKQIGRLAKKGDLPEVFFHPNAKWYAMEQREKYARQRAESLKAARNSILA